MHTSKADFIQANVCNLLDIKFFIGGQLVYVVISGGGRNEDID